MVLLVKLAHNLGFDKSDLCELTVMITIKLYRSKSDVLYKNKVKEKVG